MLSTIKNRNSSRQKGFTIIEVMIVLAIAGLIMLVVFLAVPALQRSSRNTTIKNDATALAAGIAEYSSNNDGASPNTATQGSNPADVTISGGLGTSEAVAKVNAATVVIANPTSPPTWTANSYGHLWWNKGKACDGTVNTRAVAVYYYVEGSGSHPLKCVDAK